MKKTTLRYTIVCLTLIFSLSLLAQTVPCDGTAPFEEQNGLLTIEMESGILPAGTDWKTGSEPDPNLAGSTINYIYWDVDDSEQTFNSLAGAPITYNIKINNPGTYRFAWRGRIGKGTSRGEHNDAWLRIVADDWYMTQNGNPNESAIEPIPTCNSNPNRGCPDDAKVNGYIKAFMNRDPEGSIESIWGFVTNSRFNLISQRYIWATFNNPGNYSIIVDARSSFFFMDKMVLRRTSVSDNNAFNLTNSESSCTTLSTNNNSIERGIRLFPNPAKNKIEISNLSNYQGVVTLRNILGAAIREINIQSTKHTIDISDLKSGVYILTSNNGKISFSEKFVKL